MGCCLGSDGNGVGTGKGGKGRPGPPEGGKDKQSVPNKGRDNMGKDEEDQPSQTWWRRNRGRSLLIKLNFVSVVTSFWFLIVVLSFRRINHMALKPFASIICLPIAVHHIANNYIKCTVYLHCAFALGFILFIPRFYCYSDIFVQLLHNRLLPIICSMCIILECIPGICILFISNP